MKRAIAFSALLAIYLGSSLAADAHAQLLKALPAVGGSVSTSPAQLSLKFTEGIEPGFSGVELHAADGRLVETGKASVDPGDQATLIVAVKAKLQPGSYKVTWHVVSVDTHKTQGSFSFDVKP